METVRDILAAHPAGISRAGILAWAQLRIDPDFDAARLDAELAALGSEMVERDGFLWLSSSAGAPQEPASWSGPDAGSSAREADALPGSTPPPTSWTSWTDVSVRGEGGEPDGGAIAGWSKPSGFVGSWATKIVALAIAVGFLVVNLIGFLGGDDEGAATPPPTGPRASVAGSLGPYEAMAVGDCIAIPEEDTFSEVLFMSCTVPHDAEVFFVGSSPGSDDAYPRDDEFEAYVDGACVPAFHDYTGSDFHDQSQLQMGWFVPAEDTWASGDHRVHCYLAPADGSTTDVSWRGANP